ncbi:DUF1062 domain-containing protein [Roseibium sp.]|uniref:DUF1062 domain-containing protein n=1 Tax=Roseibium sp. TaxID=1936156 RepID=UPI003BB12199
MSFLFKVEWTICCTASPTIIRPCGRCGQAVPFQSTGKFRLNANGSKLDAWLIYSCTNCGKTWNRTVFARKPVAIVPMKDLAALQYNDPVFAEQLARAPLKTAGGLEKPASGFTLISRRLTCAENANGSGLLILRNPDLGRIRLDQVLARGLKTNRKEVARLIETGLVRVQSQSKKAIRRPVPAVLNIEVQTARVPDWVKMADGELD